MKYSLVISSSKIYSTICEAEMRLEEKLKTNLTYTEDDLQPEDRLEVPTLTHLNLLSYEIKHLPILLIYI